MKTDTARALSATVFVASIVTLVLLGAAGCREFAAYVAVVTLAVMAAFIGSTADA